MISESNTPEQSELTIEGGGDDKSDQPPVEQVLEGEQTAEATQAESILTQEEARKAVDRALQDYVHAYHAGDRQKWQQFKQQLLGTNSYQIFSQNE